MTREEQQIVAAAMRKMEKEPKPDRTLDEVEERWQTYKKRGGTTDGFVYFVQEVGSGRVKIGWSERPDERIREMQTANSHTLHLVGLFSGTSRDETDVHRSLASSRVQGHREWFYTTTEVRMEALRLCTGGVQWKDDEDEF
jgi:hypothetical protein